jgi:hypothetical protein
MSYFGFKKRPSKTTERQKLIGKLDIEFSIYIRIRNADENGNVRCITCGDEHHWTDVDCGHYIPRGNMATRWNLENCGEQCRLCNSTADGKHEEHGDYIAATYGGDTALKLERMGREVKDFSAHELQGMLEELRKEIKALKAEKGFI